MKKFTLLLLVLVLCISLFGCAGNTATETTKGDTTAEKTTVAVNESESTTTEEITTINESGMTEEAASAEEKTTNVSADGSDSGVSAVVFTNKYGTATTKCKISGCENYIAKSGDTDCCEIHSEKCGTCKNFIGSATESCSFCHIGNNEHYEEPEHNPNGAFTNKHGTAATKCRIDECDNFIARHGDTDCCEIHSGKCTNCGSFIDRDNTYCSSCRSDGSGHHKEPNHNSGNKH